MSNRFTALRQKVVDDRKAFNVQAAMLHQLTTHASAKVVFAVGMGAGQVFNLLDGVLLVVDLHQPTPGSEFCRTCSGDNAPVTWPCPTTKAIASAYRHDQEFAETWEAGR